MAKKKYKFKLFNMEVTSSCPDDFIDLENLLNKAAQFERNKGHIKDCETYEKIAESILPELGAQING